MPGGYLPAPGRPSRPPGPGRAQVSEITPGKRARTASALDSDGTGAGAEGTWEEILWADEGAAGGGRERLASQAADCRSA